MRLIPETKITVLLDGEEHHFVLVAESGDGNGRLNIKAPLAVLLGMMAVGNTVKAWTPPRIVGAEPMRVELIKVEVAQ